MPRPLNHALERRLSALHRAAHEWCCVWGLSRLMRDVSIEFTDDNPSALGTIDLKTMTVRLNGLLLLEGNEALLMETLCHELAHATTACRYGLSAPEHGPEWQEFMERAGFKPRAVIPLSEIR